MISREAYRGPLTKSALAMFERADRRNGVSPATPGGRPSVSAKTGRRAPSKRALAEIGVSRARLRQWEDFGLIALQRGPGGRRVIDERVVQQVSAICALRRAGFGVREISWLSAEGPPTLEVLQRALHTLGAPLAVREARALGGVHGFKGSDARPTAAG
ncbi:MerR family transcriptional regulator [Caulobacter sp. CCNWLY153]|uniref:helix-turn-helix domain-containing protein n=1 Tax=unclassified Caulobacter TaxID=2648921 RepID=UPI002FF384AC